MDCRSFDEQVVRRDPVVADLMDQFVCVRLVQANAVDLTLFQFDYDLTFAAFFMNADRTIYGRFGSRSDRKDATKDMTLDGFRKALAAALELHKNYPANKALLAAKQPRPTAFKTPDDYPSLRGKYKPTLDYEGKVVQSCMHCHQVREAERMLYRADRKPIPDEVLYPWPMPNVAGLELDPKEMATVARVEKASPAEKAGFQPGDQITRFEGQAPLSIADIQWVLQNAPQPAMLKARVRRNGAEKELALHLETGWRRQNDLAWRVTTWDLRRMGTGGLLLREVAAEDYQRANLSPNQLALRVEHVGQYGEHAAAKKAGFQKDDIIVAVDGRTHPMTESQLIGSLLQSRMPGARVPVTVLRGSERVQLELPMQ